MFSCSLFSVIAHLTVIAHIIVINNNTNDNEGAPKPLTNNQGALSNDQGAPNRQPLTPKHLMDNQGSQDPQLTTSAPQDP